MEVHMNLLVEQSSHEMSDHMRCLITWDVSVTAEPLKWSGWYSIYWYLKAKNFKPEPLYYALLVLTDLVLTE